MKNVFILGDSYSTYEGYIPEGYRCYYGDSRKVAPIVRGVEKTWWHMLAQEAGLTIVRNDSISGSTICNTVKPILTPDTSFVNRMDKYLEERFFAENNIDTVLIFGGTNDSWIDTPAGSLMYADWTSDALNTVLPAFCYLLNKAKKAVGNIIVIVNSGLREEITDGLIEAAKKYGVKYVCLKDIDKECRHPTELGMRQITDQVMECLGK